MPVTLIYLHYFILHWRVDRNNKNICTYLIHTSPMYRKTCIYFIWLGNWIYDFKKQIVRPLNHGVNSMRRKVWEISKDYKMIFFIFRLLFLSVINIAFAVLLVPKYYSNDTVKIVNLHWFGNIPSAYIWMLYLYYF